MVTLAEVEREVMRRTGPFEQHVVSSTTASTATLVYVDAAQSTLDLGGYKGLWLLRRGFDTDGNPITGFDSADRQKRIKLWNAASGRFEVDGAYSVDPVAGEAIEICHLDPNQVIRPAVLAGLRRTTFEDRVAITLTGAATERNLTQALPWLTKKSQVKDILWREVASLYDPIPVGSYRLFETAGPRVWVSIGPDPYPNRLYVVANRPGHSWVNGGYSSDGPEADDDELAVTLDKAAAAGHIECWRVPRAAALLAAMAERKFTATQAQAADEHTRQNGRRGFNRPRPRWQLDRPLYRIRMGSS